MNRSNLLKTGYCHNETCGKPTEKLFCNKNCCAAYYTRRRRQGLSTPEKPRTHDGWTNPLAGLTLPQRIEELGRRAELNGTSGWATLA